MRRPSSSFIGTMTGLLLFLFTPINYISEHAIIFMVLFFSGSGAIIGGIVGRIFHRGA